MFTSQATSRASRHATTILLAAVSAITSLALAGGPALSGTSAQAAVSAKTGTATGAGVSGGRAVVGTASVLPAGAAYLGPARDSTPLRLDVALNPRDPAALDRFAAAVSNPSSPLYRHYLKRGQFKAVFGPAPASVAAVAAALRHAGLSVGAVSGNGLLLPVRTTVAKAEAAFGVTMRAFRLASGATGVANTTAPSLPANIAGFVQSVVGLDDLVPFAPAGVTRPADPAVPVRGRATPRAAAVGAPTACTAAVASGGLVAGQIAQAYEFGPLYQAGDYASGTTVALFELSGFPASDVSAYQSCYGTDVPVSIRPVDGGNANKTGTGALEADSDIEDLAGLAPQLASVLVYEAPNWPPGVLDAYTQIQTDDAAQVVSTSWSVCEPLLPSSLAMPESTVFQAMTTQGQSMLAASGDQGSAACNNAYPPLTQLAVNDPASDRYVTGVGGTSLSSSGLGQPPAFPPTESGWKGSGGGISSLWPMTASQTGKGVVNPYSSSAPCSASTGYCREVPDVSANAGTPYAVYSQGAWTTNWGTSLAAPTWAALIALIDGSSASCSTAPVGFLGPALYPQAASAPGDFNDITTGDNDFIGTHKGAYPATKHYDMVTGLGTPEGANLAHSLCGATRLWAPEANSQEKLFETLSPSIAFSGHTLDVAGILGLPAGTPSTIYWSTFNGTTWIPRSAVNYKDVGAATAVPPALTLNGSTPVFAWTDYATGDVEVSSYTGGTFSKPVVVGAGTATSNVAPAITAAGGNLFVVWKGKTTKSLYFSTRTGTTWSSPQVVTGASTPYAPAITFYPGQDAAVIAWTTSGGTLQYVVHGTSGFGGVATIPGASSTGPALTVLGNQLYAAWKGAKPDHHIWYSADSPNDLYTGTWSPEQTVPQALTPYTPAIAASGPALVAAWTGNTATSKTSDQVWYSSSGAP
jgi:hypothetical protein